MCICCCYGRIFDFFAIQLDRITYLLISHRPASLGKILLTKMEMKRKNIIYCFISLVVSLCPTQVVVVFYVRISLVALLSVNCSRIEWNCLFTLFSLFIRVPEDIGIDFRF